MFNFARNFFSRNYHDPSSKRRSSKRATLRVLMHERLETREVFNTTVSIPANMDVEEGKIYEFPITRTGDISRPTTLNYTFMRSAQAEPNKDFTRERSMSGTVTLGAGIKNFKLAPVKIVADKIDEYDESFYLSISLANGSQAKLANDTTRFLIKDKDLAPNVSISPLVAAKNEDSGSAYFRLTLDAPTEKFVYVKIRGNSIGTLKWGQDVRFAEDMNDPRSERTVIFDSMSTQRDFSVAIIDDKTIEPDEKLEVVLTEGVGISGFGTTKAVVTIKDNDVPILLISDAVPITEGLRSGATAKFKIRIEQPMEREVKVKYWTTDGDAKSPSDYVANRNILTFGGNPSEKPAPSEQTVSVPVVGDSIQESKAENFYLNIGPIDSSAPNRINAPRGFGKATIVDDDALPSITVGTPAPISAIPTPEKGFGTVQYRWAAARNAAKYEIYVRKENSAFSVSYATGDNKTTYSPSSFFGSSTGLTSKGTYFWKVRAVNAKVVGDWSAEQQFVMPEQIGSF